MIHMIRATSPILTEEAEKNASLASIDVKAVMPRW